MRLIVLHPNQSKVIKDNHRFKVIVCGRRFGKTTLAIIALIKEAISKKENKLWYVAPTYRQAKQISWDMLKHYLRKIEWVVEKINESELSVLFVNGSKIELKGADNEDSLRGVGLGGVILDEYAQIKSNVFTEIIRPMLTESRGWAWFVGTPKGFNHFWEIYNKHKDDSDYISFRFTSYDNPLLDRKEIEKAKQELSATAFEQEYLAKFTKFTGLVYPDFEQARHVVKPFDLPPIWYRIAGIDFGFNNPTAIVWIAVSDDGDFYIYDEYYQAKKTTKEITEIYKQRNSGVKIGQLFGDPSAKQLIADYQQYGVYVTPANNDVQAGIAAVTKYIKLNKETNKPRLYVFSNCHNLVNEFETYRWQEKRENSNEKEEPVKENDHLMDALRYALFTFTKPTQQFSEEEYQPQYEPLNEWTGY